MMLDRYLNKVTCGDCLELMKEIDDGSVDLILCDLPYGTTACSWDTIIPFEPLWAAYKRIIKPNGAIVLTASQPFTTALIASNTKMFRYEWIWIKTISCQPQNSHIMPMKKHENILVFYNHLPTYNPQFEKGEPYNKTAGNVGMNFYREGLKSPARTNSGFRYPSSISTKFGNGNYGKFHPTQKPVALMSYLIKTYTNEGELVLDNCAGSGTTGVAAKQLNRKFILIEKEQKYCDIAREQLKQEVLGL